MQSLNGFLVNDITMQTQKTLKYYPGDQTSPKIQKMIKLLILLKESVERGKK